MHPIFRDELNMARIADRHRRAQRHRLARACAQARRARRQYGKAPAGGAAAVAARRMLIILGARGA
jgi:hypothetical protein